ncbi:PAS domain S-box protein [Leptothoe sp. ISB3NOV94-8A]
MDERLSVLFIADSEEHLLPILQVLRSSGFYPSWEWVKTAEPLHRKTANRSWGVIIFLDNALSEFDVFAALAIIEQNQPDTPCIVISAIAGERRAVEIIKAGAHDYLLQDDLGLLPEIVRNETRKMQLESQRFLVSDKSDGSRNDHGVTSSDRKESQRLREARVDATFVQSTVGYVETNLQTMGLTFVNPYFCKMMGYSQAELLGMGVDEISHPDDTEESFSKIRQLFLRKIESFELEKRYRRKDGSFFWAEITVYPLHFQENQVTHCFAIIQDISERKKAEQEREGFFNLSQDLLCIASSEGYFLKVNPAWQTTLGHAQDELIGFPFINFVHPEDRIATLEEFHRLNYDNKIGLNFENRYRCKDGSYKWLSWRSSPDVTTGVVYAIARDITSIKQAQHKLQHLNQELEDKIEERTKALMMTQSAVDLAADCVFLIRSDGSFHYANKTACAKLGYTQEEFRQMNVFAINVNVFPENWVKMWQTLKKESSLTFESQHRSKNGHIYPVEINTRYLNFDGQEYCFSFVRDISYRKLAEATIKKENTFRQQILENMAEGLCVCQQIDEFPFIRHTVWNRKMQAITGYSIEEVNHLGVIPGLISNAVDQKNYVQQYMEHLRMDSVPALEEAEIYRKDGQKRTISISTSVLSDFEGHFTVLALVQDITERKQSQQNASLLAAVVESTDDAIITTNLDDIITSWNSAAVNLFGYTETEAIGQPISILFPPDRLDIAPQILERITNGERIKNFETINLHKNGTPINVSATISPLKDETGKVVGASKIIRDITEQKRAEVQLRLTNEELMRATRLKDEFLANMSHELRTPLNAILGMTESLQKQAFGTINQKQLKPLQLIERSGAHLLELINDILDVAKIESGQMKLDLQPTIVILLCKSSLDFVKQQAYKKAIQIETKFPPHIPDVWLDERRIRQALINLLSNAVKFTSEEGRITLAVSLQGETKTLLKKENRTLVEKTVLRFSVTDTGIGIAPEYISQLFQPFIQIDGSLNRRYPGTGLGLALVKRIAELHGGEVGVSSQSDMGSCFTMDIPCEVVTSYDEVSAIKKQTELSVTTKPAPKKRASLILLAEENAANIITISSYLRAKGHRLQIAADVKKISNIAQLTSPDLILMDLHVLGNNSLEIIQQIRLNSYLKIVPIIALIDPFIDNSQDDYYDAGVNHCIHKPCNLQQLIDTMQKLL